MVHSVWIISSGASRHIMVSVTRVYIERICPVATSKEKLLSTRILSATPNNIPIRTGKIRTLSTKNPSANQKMNVYIFLYCSTTLGTFRNQNRPLVHNRFDGQHGFHRSVRKGHATIGFVEMYDLFPHRREL